MCHDFFSYPALVSVDPATVVVVSAASSVVTSSTGVFVLALGSSPDDPTGSLDLDDPATLTALAGRIEASGAALVIIDTVGMVTDRNLCRPEEARDAYRRAIEFIAKSLQAK